MSKIVLAGKYATVHTKNWAVPPKKPELKHDQIARGPCRIRLKDEKGRKQETYRNPDEMLKAMHERTQAKLAPHKIQDQDSFQNVAKQTGRGMWHTQLVRQIIKLNSDLWCEDCVAIPTCAGFYKMVHGVKTFTGACFTRGFVPEFSIINPDNAGQMTSAGITYGWRMVLARLVNSGDLTMNQVVRTWGDVQHSDERGKHWAGKVGRYRT
jgi:hypothetical protein